MNVVVDIGNTRLKWGLARGGRLEATGGAVHAGDAAAAIERFVAAVPDDVERVLVANVAGEEIAQPLAARLEAARGVEPRFLVTAAEQAGVRCAYAEPWRLGPDRWAAIIAAHHACSGTVCIIDAGTTVTFDAVDARGRHLGGLILAGPRMAADALQRNTRRVRASAGLEQPPRGLDVLGRSTETAVARGALLAVAGAVDRAVRIVAEAAGAAPVLLLTGGDGPALAPWLENPTRYEADLILEGLARLADEGGV